MAAAQGGNSGSPAFPSCSQAHFLGHQLLFAPGPAKCFVYLLGKWWREWEFSPPLRKRVGVSDRCIHLEFKVQVCGGGRCAPPQVPGQTLSPAQAPDLQKKPCLFCNFGGVWAGVELGLSFQSALSTGKIHLTSQPTPVTCLWRLNKWIDSHELPPHPQHAGSWS